MREIDKVSLAKGAVFDYEEIVCHTEIDYSEIKRGTEKLLRFADRTKSELRLVYYDKKTRKELMLFVKKGYLFGVMQIWIVEGVCETKDYDPSMEFDGSIQKWLEVEIE